MNLEGVAKASGIRSAGTAKNAGQFQRSVRTALARKGPHLIVAKVASLDNDRPARARRLPDPRENKYRFAAYIERTAGVEILGSGLGGG
jgi:hypothetical protein